MIAYVYVVIVCYDWLDDVESVWLNEVRADTHKDALQNDNPGYSYSVVRREVMNFE